MRKIDQLLAEYGESHQNAFNKKVHWVCVPAIFFSIVGLVWEIPSGGLQSLFQTASPWLNWASVALGAVIMYYALLSIPLALAVSGVAAACLGLAYWVDFVLPVDLWLVCLVVFVLAWVGQFYGHKIEGKKPSFLKDVQFLLIGPAWLMHFVFKSLGIRY